MIIMLSPKFSLFWLLGFLCIFLCAGYPNNAKSCMESDKEALLKLKDGFIDDSGTLSPWEHEVDCCKWSGISCNHSTGYVIMFDLHNYYLKGDIDSSLCDLRHLVLLNLDFNQFDGSKIPKCIDSLGQLRELRLSNTNISGTIPHGLQNLSNLQIIDLGGNSNLIANDLDWIPHLSSLRYLDLSGVNLSQVIGWQSSLSNKTPQLRTLKLHESSLYGVISHEMKNLSNLQILDLGWNSNLIANNLQWISHLSSLRYLDLSGSNLSQAIDWQSSLGMAPSLVELNLAGCALISYLNPKSFFPANSSSSLKVLYLASNYLDSSILPWVSNISKVLTRLDLSRNILQHAYALNINSLQVLDLRENSLQLDPGAFSNLNSLESLDLSYGSLQQIVPKAFANMISLKSLYLTSTSLQHFSPDAFKNTTSLKVLEVAHNNLDNSMVNSISNLCQLKELGLSYNKFSDKLSEWIPQVSCAQYSLEMLDLSDNPFSEGPFPNFSRFSSLVQLDLANTSLHGPMPQSFGPLPHLSRLDLSYNNLSESLPQFIGLRSLSYLDLSNNHLSGPLAEIDGLPSLEHLDISNNKLNEILPRTFRNLPLLSILDLSSNKLNHEINETYLSTLSCLKILDVSNNPISVNFNSNWVPPFQLEYFLASSCNCGPQFPTWLKYQRELVALDISYAQIFDSIPQWILLFPNLRYLNISHNKIHGEWPKSVLMKLESAYTWDLSFNNFSGPLPYFPQKATGLFLSNNMFSGTISFICATFQSQLYYLDMSSNSLSGRLPDCWKQFPLLRVLKLAYNNFSGRIPNSITTLIGLQSIHLNNNNFSGQMPSLINSPNLLFIDFGQNNLIGKLPSWTGHSLPNLVGLRLQANKFHGTIPTNFCNFPILQILDLSQNNIAGSIPYCFNNLRALSNITFFRQPISFNDIFLDGFLSHDILSGIICKVAELENALLMEKAMLVWKGELVEYGKNLGLMTTIDLSCNHLTGEIPSSITTLAALASLNLSRNKLIGSIPDNMGQMKRLESLDLSSNTLSGEIPNTFSALSFLSFLNLSFNNLSGKIPIGTQLQSFDASSYIGNQGLCGQPLKEICPGDGSSYPSPNPPNIDADDENDKFISFGFYVCMAFGFIFGFWGVCGSLVLKNSWRHSFFHFFENMNDWIYIHVTVLKAKLKRRFQD